MSCDGTVGYVSDSLYLQPAEMSDATPSELRDVAFTVDQGHVSILGLGIITAVQNGIVVGYDSGYTPTGTLPSSLRPVNALEWTHHRLSILGHGVAWGANSRGDVVGDNRQTLESVGNPTLWRNGRATVLSSENGTAFAIRDDGAIVGDVGSRAFLVRPNGPTRKLIFLDTLVSGSWRICAAYDIATNGDILALATRGGTSEVVLLAPRH